MEIRTFQAGSLQEALRKAREAFGEEAVVLHTRQFEERTLFGLRRENRVEVTAQTPPGHAARPENRPLSDRLDARQALYEQMQRSPYEDTAPEARRSGAAILLDRRYEEQVEQRPESRASAGIEERLKSFEIPQRRPLNADHPTLLELELARKLDREIAFGGPIFIPPGQQKVVAFVGPTGAGKTTTLVKLAAHFALSERRQVGLLTIDTLRIGASEQLCSFAELLDMPVEVVGGTQRLSSALKRLADCELVLLDTPGSSPWNDSKLQMIAEALDAVRADEVHLMIPAVATTASLQHVMREFQLLSYTDLTITKWDEAESVAELLPVLRNSTVPLRYLTTGQSVPDDIEIAAPDRLARLPLADLITDRGGSVAAVSIR